ncbi:MAG: ATP-dependent DNA helicase RecG [Bacteroidota bacterium]|nr:ATP-dependent DNA helicase RecG [Bacteroidota bacterium]MDP4204734.1 ATP-dependent DNA helicase RecG [Bacteroidota bacterium]
MSTLEEQDIKFLPGVGPKRALLLSKELNINNCSDLLYYFPYKYIDRTRIYTIREINGSMPYIQLKGKIISMQQIGDNRKKRLVAMFSDGTGTLELIWFQGISWTIQNIKLNTEYLLFGKPSEFNGKINVAHPDLEEPAKSLATFTGYLQAYYNTTEKLKNSFLHSKAIHKLQIQLLSQLKGKIAETLPTYLIQKLKLISLEEALFNIHIPTNPELLHKAQFRLKFEELFYIQLKILSLKNLRDHKFRGHIFHKIGYYFNSFYKNNLPFELTNAQKRVIREIRLDVGSGKQMNRLLQGDVGSGKTMVALMTALMAIDNGYQACLMAPTEILANQHYESIKGMLAGLTLQTGLLTGSTRKAERKTIHEHLLSGEMQLLIGTHALIEDTVNYRNLGLVIIDEQHRFGVEQRSRLWAKNSSPPHILVMTATPIPRTLAMTIYGDLDVSVIDELPPGRKPIQTLHYFENRRASVYDFIRKQIAAGRQIYIVYPLIKESEKLDYKNLEEGYEHIRKAFPLPHYQVSMVHGKMKAADKDFEMQRFVKGETQIMVATTVIEVGVNVPNASVMIIENAERFGLSQLHQLRGRVGRGCDQSYCILMSDYKISAESRKRLDIMVRSTDGFEIAEADLKLRGPGDLEGTQQSGLPIDLKIANLARDSQILQYAREIALRILEEDGTLNHRDNLVLKEQLKKFSKTQFNWSNIS